MNEKYKIYLEEVALGYGTESGKAVERRAKILPPVYRRQAFRDDYPKGRIVVELKSVTNAGVVCECRIYTSDTASEPIANGFGFYPGNDVTAYGAAQTKAERHGLTRAGYSYPEETTETEPIMPVDTVTPVVTPVTENLHEMDEDGNIVAPSKKITRVAPKPETKQQAKAPVEASNSDAEPQTADVGMGIISDAPKLPEGKCAGMTLEEVKEQDPTYFDALVSHMKDPEKRERLRLRSPGIFSMLENKV